ncbi:rhamnogalacturonan acetylesterase [Pinibacter aurantiacus]|uniref:Rhamnogalacturonan acetylesterase n=1 Tax=Pinibacter aurantiacus TaxID=2851599 RepID=A0A9E2W496_9BACT|nr:rhamnogalacturonan acetylesterase [Pinibacter aurantiacus]MBV4357619.1 rhamnogalacturonan acetylesterase [Pinibacter aurantiacus]
MKKSFAVLLIALASFALPPKKIKIWLVGDSTMSDKKTEAYPETGWGMPFKYFFDSTVVVDNRAQNGRSTKTFISEGRWQAVMDGLNEGDYVFIQFGHNDEVPTKVNSYVTEDVFKSNLQRFVKEVRSKNGVPVLLTPVARRKFDNAGVVEETHEKYAAVVRNVAKEEKVLFIDLDEKSKVLLQQYGVENSKLLFNQLQPGEHPNYPEGKEDNTHFNELGARKMAELVLAEIKEQKFDIANRIVQGKNKK